MKRFTKALSAVLLVLILIGTTVGCTSEEREEFRTLEDLETATIGIITGSSWDTVAKREFPDAEKMYFSSAADMLLALEQGKIDTFFMDKTMYAGMRWENVSLSYIDESVGDISNALILAKEGYDEELLKELNAFVARCGEEGVLDSLADKWFGNTEPEEHPDYTALTGEKGTLRVAVSDSMKPTSYQRGSLYTGYEVDFLTMFAEEHGYRLEIEGMNLDALISSVSVGKYDIGACGLTVTPERMESVTFADTHFETYGVAVVRSSSADAGAGEILTPEDLKGKKVAVLTGTLWDKVAKEELAGAEVMHFSTTADLLLALEQGKVSAIIGPRTFYATAGWEDVPVNILTETKTSILSGFMLARENYDRDLLECLNEFIEGAKKDGTVEALYEKWLSDKEPTEHPDYTSLPAVNGTLRVAVDNTARPMVYRKNDTFTGFDVELLTLFAEAYGYGLEFEGMSFDALIPFVSEGRCHIGACGIGITPERAESVTFTDSYVELEGVVLVSRGVSAAEKTDFFSSIASSFEKTFIREGRWRMLLEGVGVTLIISISAILGGTALGLCLYMLCRSDKKPIRLPALGLARVYSRIIAGTPVVVILMILFYVVFGNIRGMGGVPVAIVCFSLTFGAFVYGHMSVAVSSVDPGQTEAALSLGYSKSRAFFRIILPQAMRIFMPSYCSQAVELVKATAVVGYIAVNDLTKMGDIIRSNTYEVFFPLIATALIYFMLTWGLSLLLRLVTRAFEPKTHNRERILKGVRTDSSAAFSTSAPRNPF